MTSSACIEARYRTRSETRLVCKHACKHYASMPFRVSEMNTTTFRQMTSRSFTFRFGGHSNSNFCFFSFRGLTVFLLSQNYAFCHISPSTIKRWSHLKTCDFSIGNNGLQNLNFFKNYLSLENFF